MRVESWYPTPDPPVRRPVGVWVITVIYFVMYGLMAVGMLLALPEFEESMAALTVLDRALMWINGGLDVAGVTCLFLLRRPAVPLLGAALVVSVIGAIALLAGVWMGGGTDTFTLVMSFVMLPLPAAVWWYARRLRQGGVLR